MKKLILILFIMPQLLAFAQGTVLTKYNFGTAYLMSDTKDISSKFVFGQAIIGIQSGKETRLYSGFLTPKPPAPNSIEITEENNGFLSVYPIPASDELKLKIDKLISKPVKLRIVNLLGVTIEESTFEHMGKSDLVINTTNYSSGIYQLELITSTDIYSIGFVIRK